MQISSYSAAISAVSLIASGVALKSSEVTVRKVIEGEYIRRTPSSENCAQRLRQLSRDDSRAVPKDWQSHSGTNRRLTKVIQENSAPGSESFSRNTSSNAAFNSTNSILTRDCLPASQIPTRCFDAWRKPFRHRGQIFSFARRDGNVRADRTNFRRSTW